MGRKKTLPLDLIKVRMLQDAFGCDLVNGWPGPRKLFKKNSEPELCASIVRSFLASGYCEVIETEIEVKKDEIKTSDCTDDGTRHTVGAEELFKD